MLKNNIYYLLKPVIPRILQVGLRRGAVSRKRSGFSDIWPIDEWAGKEPESWPGWPEGKKFALVLTHDVDTDHGQRRCPELMRLEMEMGFRSCFYFVPERYRILPEIQEDLVEHGYEVGVHGLKHDGKLYRSRALFKRRAEKINRYLKDWQAVGFRSPSMHYHRDWIHDLNVEYDASTFDTDPFEPQSDGVRTIYPYFQPSLSSSDGAGYVELPYTIPQDFLLYVLMRESDISVWKKKVDWIASKGGMVLVDTHPDYMSIDGTRKSREEYPIVLYKELLAYIKERYADQYWHPLPREMARFVRDQGHNVKHRKPRRICMMAYAFYETDNRIIRYAETLTRRGDEVDVIALRRPEHSSHECINGVNVFRIQKRVRNERGKFSYLGRLLRFLLHSSWFLGRQHVRRKYDLIHVHSVPDFEVFAAWYPRMTGAKTILDVHDIVPEFYASKFGVSPSSVLYKLLVLIERASTCFADHVIIANDIWHKKLTARSVGPHKCTSFLNYADPEVFYPRDRTRDDHRFLIVYPGGLQWHQGIDIAINAFARICHRAPQAEFHIYGEGSEKDGLVGLVEKLDLKDRVRFEDSVPFRDIPAILADADLGVVAKRANSFGNEAFSTKIFEYMSLGVPVIASDTQIDRYYFNDSVVKFFKSGDEEDLANCMIDMITNSESRKTLIENALRYVKSHNWDLKKQEYLDLVDQLCRT